MGSCCCKRRPRPSEPLLPTSQPGQPSPPPSPPSGPPPSGLWRGRYQIRGSGVLTEFVVFLLFDQSDSVAGEGVDNVGYYFVSGRTSGRGGEHISFSKTYRRGTANEIGVVSEDNEGHEVKYQGELLGRSSHAGYSGTWTLQNDGTSSDGSFELRPVPQDAAAQPSAPPQLLPGAQASQALHMADDKKPAKVLPAGPEVDDKKPATVLPIAPGAAVHPGAPAPLAHDTPAEVEVQINGVMVPLAIAREFADALRQEYIAHVPGAVGHFFDSGKARGDVVAALDQVEAVVRDSSDKQAALVALAVSWGLGATQECDMGGVMVTREVAREFLDALRQEYVAGVGGAVGRFFSSGKATESMVKAMGRVEMWVRDSNDKPDVLRRMAQGWGL